MYTWQYFIVGLCEHLAWPVVVIWCAYLFRKDICKMLSRITKLPGGAELEPEVGKQKEYKPEVRRQQEDKKEFEKILAQKNEKEQKDSKENVESGENKECVK